MSHERGREDIRRSHAGNVQGENYGVFSASLISQRGVICVKLLQTQDTDLPWVGTAGGHKGGRVTHPGAGGRGGGGGIQRPGAVGGGLPGPNHQARLGLG